MNPSEYAEYLCETGAPPIRNKARDIQRDRRKALHEFEAAQRLYDNRCAEIEKAEKRLANWIESLWDSDEIKHAETLFMASNRPQGPES